MGNDDPGVCVGGSNAGQRKKVTQIGRNHHVDMEATH